MKASTDDNATDHGPTIEQGRRTFRDIVERVNEEVQTHPLRTVGIALGAGYIAGGGLFSALTGRILVTGLRLGLRVAALPLVRNEVLGFVDTLSAERGGTDTEERRRQ